MYCSTVTKYLTCVDFHLCTQHHQSPSAMARHYRVFFHSIDIHRYIERKKKKRRKKKKKTQLSCGKRSLSEWPIETQLPKLPKSPCHRRPGARLLLPWEPPSKCTPGQPRLSLRWNTKASALGCGPVVVCKTADSTGGESRSGWQPPHEPHCGPNEAESNPTPPQMLRKPLETLFPIWLDLLPLLCKYFALNTSRRKQKI